MGLKDVVKKAAFVDILRGMSVTGTYFVVDKVTVEYPKEKLQTYPRFRGIHALLTDPGDRRRQVRGLHALRHHLPVAVHPRGGRGDAGRPQPRPDASSSTWPAASSAGCAKRSARWRPS